jgi:hypothetical protein
MDQAIVRSAAGRHLVMPTVLTLLKDVELATEAILGDRYDKGSRSVEHESRPGEKSTAWLPYARTPAADA